MKAFLCDFIVLSTNFVLLHTPHEWRYLFVFECIKQASFPDDLPHWRIQIFEKERPVKISVVIASPLN